MMIISYAEQDETVWSLKEEPVSKQSLKRFF